MRAGEKSRRSRRPADLAHDGQSRLPHGAGKCIRIVRIESLHEDVLARPRARISQASRHQARSIA